jgi:hypothetical protein
VSGDLRFISETQRETARAKMRELVAQSLAGTSATITFEDGYPAMTPNDGNYKLLAELDRVSRDLGFGAVEALDPGERGAGDIAFVSSLISGLDGIGGENGDNSHAPGEWAELASFPTLTKRAAILLYRLTRWRCGRRSGAMFPGGGCARALDASSPAAELSRKSAASQCPPALLSRPGRARSRPLRGGGGGGG